MLLLLWRLVFPFLHPVVILPFSFFQPLQWIILLITFGCYLLHPVAALVFIGVAAIWYVYGLAVPPSPIRHPRVYTQWQIQNRQGGQFERTVFTVGMPVIFLAVLTWLPDWSSVLRWLAAAGLGYYVSAVVMGWIAVLTTPSFEQQLREITADPLAPLKTPKA